MTDNVAMSDILILVADVIELPADRARLIDAFVDGIMDDLSDQLKRGTMSYDMVRDDLRDAIMNTVNRSTVQWIVSKNLDAVVIVARESAKMTKEQRFVDGTDVLAFMEKDRRFDRYTFEEKIDIIKVSHVPMQMTIDYTGMNDIDTYK